jgi:carbonic anhydrase/acetyltransferase-like protein (isoleucine patch superfamily)
VEKRRLGTAALCGAGLNALIAYREHKPDVHSTVFIAEGARIIGDVRIGSESSVWFNTIVRGDVNFIRIGSRTNIQDNSVLHVTSETAPLAIGSDVTVGHSVVLHGCTIEDGCLIGMGAVILDGAHIGSGSLIAAGSVVLEGGEIPTGSLAAGIPAKVKRALTEEEKGAIKKSAMNYVGYSRNYISNRV